MLRVGVADRVDCADGEEVLRGEKRCGRSGGPQHGSHRFAGPVDSSQISRLDGGVNRDAGGRECVHVALVAFVGDEETRGVAEEADATMPVFDEVSYGIGRPGTRIAEDLIGEEILGRSVHEDVGDTGLLLHGEVVVFVAGGGDDDPVDAVARH